jgi:hypothetical protein
MDHFGGLDVWVKETSGSKMYSYQFDFAEK